MRAVVFALCALGALLFARSVNAEDCVRSDARAIVEHIFSSADGDSDGSLSSAEYAAAGLESYGVSFEEADADSDGRTTLAEYLALYDRHHPSTGELEA